LQTGFLSPGPAVVLLAHVPTPTAELIGVLMLAFSSDGMAVDVRGNLYTTHSGNVHIYDANGKHLQQIDVPEGPANVCFGDDDFKTLFITARTSLYSVRMTQPGARIKTNQ